MAEVTTGGENNSAAPYELHSGKAAVWCKPPVWPSFASGFLLSRDEKWIEKKIWWLERETGKQMMDMPSSKALMQNAWKATSPWAGVSFLFRLNWLVGAWLHKHNSTSSEACKHAILKCDFHRDFRISTYNAICGFKQKNKFYIPLR